MFFFLICDYNNCKYFKVARRYLDLIKGMVELTNYIQRIAAIQNFPYDGKLHITLRDYVISTYGLAERQSTGQKLKSRALNIC